MNTNNTTKNTGQEINTINNKFNTPKSDVNKFKTKINFNYNISSGTNNLAKNHINPLHKFTNANSSITGGNNINVNNSMAISSGFSNQNNNNNVTNIHKNSTGGSYMSNNNMGSKTTNSKQGIKDIYKLRTTGTGSNIGGGQSNNPITISTPVNRDNIKSFTKNLQNTSSIGTNNKINNNNSTNNNANNGFVYIAANNNANNQSNRIQPNNNSSVINKDQNNIINSNMNKDQASTKGKFSNFNSNVFSKNHPSTIKGSNNKIEFMSSHNKQNSLKKFK
jgi:hypothetical protein